MCKEHQLRLRSRRRHHSAPCSPHPGHAAPFSFVPGSLPPGAFTHAIPSTWNARAPALPVTASSSSSRSQLQWCLHRAHTCEQTLRHGFSNCGTWTSSIGISQELVAGASSQGHPRPLNKKPCRGRPSICVSTSPLGALTHSRLRTFALRSFHPRSSSYCKFFQRRDCCGPGTTSSAQERA